MLEFAVLAATGYGMCEVCGDTRKHQVALMAATSFQQRSLCCTLLTAAMLAGGPAICVYNADVQRDRL